MSEQPEQWAVDWRKVAELAQDYEDPRLNKAVSALHGSIQRAFAEREAELVAENAKLREELELCGHAQANLVRVAEKARNRWKEAQDNLDLILPFVAKFAAAVGHYDRTPPRFPGSSFNHDPDPGSHLALSVSVHGQAPMQGPTITDLRLLAEAYNIVTSQALAQQDTTALKSREADRG